jgi:Uma2 family endonuclease
MGALRKPTQSRMTIDDFLVWDSGDHSGRPWRLIDGIPRAMALATTAHGAIQAELSRLLGNHLVQTRQQCRVVVEPGITPRLHASTNVRIPDIAIACGPPRSYRTETGRMHSK